MVEQGLIRARTPGVKKLPFNFEWAFKLLDTL
jgi:hypothetical protein